jgi:hypothetical protein
MGGKMADEKKSEEQNKGFVVRDKRFTAKDEEQGPQARGPEKEKEPEEQAPLPEVNFVTFLLSLSTSALIQLGEIEDPAAKQPVKNLPLAKQTIDLIGMLKEKTKGNLTSDEDRLMENILFDLRMRYVKAAE